MQPCTCLQMLLRKLLTKMHGTHLLLQSRNDVML